MGIRLPRWGNDEPCDYGRSEPTPREICLVLTEFSRSNKTLWSAEALTTWVCSIR